MGSSRALSLILGGSFSGVLIISEHLLSLSYVLGVKDTEMNRMRAKVFGVKNFIEE